MPSVVASYDYTNQRIGIGNESVPKIVINDSKFILTAISILVISNRNSLQVLFDKIASVYYI